MEPTFDKKLCNEELECAKLNVGKTVTVNLISDTKVLNILGATKFMGEFRYVMHKAKNPRNNFIHEDIAMLANIGHGYYFVDPMRIII